MKDFEEIDAIDLQYCGPNGRPTLGKSFDLLMQRWRGGSQDRETALRLLFLAWYSYSEPKYLTGLESNPPADLFRDLIESLGGENAEDDEFCFVMRVMTEVGAWCFGNVADESYWSNIGERFSQRLGERIYHINPNSFLGRGAYGQYFAHQARGQAKYRSEHKNQ